MSCGGGLHRKRRNVEAVHAGGGHVHGADVPGLPGRPGPWPWPYPRPHRRLAAGTAGPAADLGAGAGGGNRQVIAVMRGRLERGEPVTRMYGPLGLAWLQRQVEIAEQLIRARGQTPSAP